MGRLVINNAMTVNGAFEAPSPEEWLVLDPDSSNVSLEQLAALHERSAVKPSFVQNRCFARGGWDREVRRFCAKAGIVYQGFSLLTANPRALASPAVQATARRTGRSPAQVVFRFAIEAGIRPAEFASGLPAMRLISL